MTTKLRVGMKGLLPLKGVTLTSEFNGSIRSVVKELRSAHPDLEWVQELLRPTMMVGFPGIEGKFVVAVEGDKFVFDCSRTFLVFLMNYCETMQLKYSIGHS